MDINSEIIKAATPEQAAAILELVKKQAAEAAAAEFLASGQTKPKPGWQTTEFWLAIAVNAGTIISAAAAFIPYPWGALAVAASGVLTSIGYSYSRAIAKAPGEPQAVAKDIAPALADLAKAVAAIKAHQENQASTGGIK